ncbi:unnamed protein product [Calypogeia fissa]
MTTTSTSVPSLATYRISTTDFVRLTNKPQAKREPEPSNSTTLVVVVASSNPPRPDQSTRLTRLHSTQMLRFLEKSSQNAGYGGQGGSRRRAFPPVPKAACDEAQGAEPGRQRPILFRIGRPPHWTLFYRLVPLEGTGCRTDRLNFQQAPAAVLPVWPPGTGQPGGGERAS